VGVERVGARVQKNKTEGANDKINFKETMGKETKGEQWSVPSLSLSPSPLEGSLKDLKEK